MNDLGPRPTMSTARAAELIGTTAKNVAAYQQRAEQDNPLRGIA